MAELSRADATQRRVDVERLVDLMMFRLYDKLASVGKVDLLFDVASAVRDHYASATVAANPEDTRKRALARTNLGTCFRRRGR